MAEASDIVTQVREREQRRGNPFREVLARPGALRFSAAGFVGRGPEFLFRPGTLLLMASGDRREGPGRGLAALVPVYLGLGAMFATIDLSTVEFAQEQGHKPLAGFILGAYALGSAVGGLCYGSRTWHAPVHRRFALTLCTVAAGTDTFWALPGLAVLAAVIFCSGLAISPTFIARFSLIEQQAPAQRRAWGVAWLTSAISVCVAVGSAVARRVLQRHRARWGYVFAAGCGAAAS